MDAGHEDLQHRLPPSELTATLNEPRNLGAEKPISMDRVRRGAGSDRSLPQELRDRQAARKHDSHDVLWHGLGLGV